MIYHPWNSREIGLLRRHRGPDAPEPLPLKAVARLLGRPKNCVSAQASRLGLSTRRHLTPDDLPRVRQLIDRGFSQIDMARDLGVCEKTVMRFCRRHGIKTHYVFGTHDERTKRRMIEAQRKTLVSEGYRSVAAARWARRRVETLSRWPSGVVTPALARVLDQLERAPATIAELAVQVGHQPSVISRHLRSLAALDLVAAEGYHPCTWSLAGPALQAAQRRKDAS